MKHKHPGRTARRRAARIRRVKRRLTNAAAALLALIIIALAVYILYWYANRGRIEADGERYRQMYAPATTDGRALPERPADAPAATEAPATTEAPTLMPTDVPTPAPAQTPQPTDVPTPEATARRIAVPTPTVVPLPAETPVSTNMPTIGPTSSPEPEPAATPEPEPAETSRPERTEAPLPTAERIAAPAETPEAAPPAPDFAVPDLEGGEMPAVRDAPVSGADGGTLVLALPTPPPVQDSFAELLAHNPDTVGFLDVDGIIALPVVHRQNDNEYYLNHTFDGAEAPEGALFLDGLNRLVPEDDCLIVYGHNMKNDTMFGRLSDFGSADFMKQHSIIRFDTIYENRLYVPFAAFSASVEPGNRHFFDVRQFLFDEVEFEKFVLKLRGRSRYTVPVDVAYGDRLLLLVTCDYTDREGRFILALRQLRPDEKEANVWALAMQAEEK